ncbi:MAG: alternative ribosome rescue aminoacyl-tRNA hydrolase ArfB [Saprospiraceae bacterium]
MNTAELVKELKFRTSRSSGKGGQHVNKVETRVELIFNVAASNALAAHEKAIIKDRLSNKISNEGLFQISSQAKRSQLLNRQEATNKFLKLIEKALIPKKVRKKKKPTKGMIEKRLKKKKIHGEKKALRQKVQHP